MDAVLDAGCPGGANALLNPIDGSCIVDDVLGNPRWDAGNSKRIIGAVQNVQSPHLTLDPVAAINRVRPSPRSNQLTASINWPVANDVVATASPAPSTTNAPSTSAPAPNQTNLVIDLYGYFK